jgi:hypothetical protein
MAGRERYGSSAAASSPGSLRVPARPRGAGRGQGNVAVERARLSAGRRPDPPSPAAVAPTSPVPAPAPRQRPPARRILDVAPRAPNQPAVPAQGASPPPSPGADIRRCFVDTRTTTRQPHQSRCASGWTRRTCRLRGGAAASAPAARPAWPVDRAWSLWHSRAADLPVP